MADGMSFGGYINNPSNGATVVTNRSMYKRMYKEKFDKILLRENGGIRYSVFHNSKDDSYYIYLKIPSEVINNFYYDVVVQLYTTESSKKNNVNLSNHGARFYSNDPAFVYTFAHAFNENDLFIKDLSSKMSKKALKNVATIKNPKDNIWYVKSLYFAYLAMEKYNLFNRAILDRESKEYNTKSFNDIMKADDKIALRISAEEKQKKEKEKGKQNNDNNVRQRQQSNTTKKSTISKVSTITNKTKAIKTVKKSGIVKRK